MSSGRASTLEKSKSKEELLTKEILAALSATKLADLWFQQEKTIGFRASLPDLIELQSEYSLTGVQSQRL